MTRNLLYIALDFPPLNSSGTYRSAKFVKYLGRFGWQPVVVTLDWYKEPMGDPLDESLLSDVPAAVPVIRLPHFNPAFSLYHLVARYRPGRLAHDPIVTLSEIPQDDQPRSRFYRLARSIYHRALTPVGDPFFYWSFRVWPACVKLARQHQVKVILVSISPWTTALLGVLLKRTLHVPLVVDFRDYWTQWAVKKQPTAGDLVETWVERWILRQADRVICVHQAMADDFARMEPACAGRCRVITNGYDVDDFGGTDAGLLSHDRSEVGPTHLIHTGIVWGDAAVPLLRALAQLKRDCPDPGLRVSFVGGLPPSSLRFIDEHDLGDLVEVHPRVSHREVIQRMCRADVLLLLIVGNEGGRKWYPGKLFEYMYAGRPVLAVAPEGIAARLIERAGIGLTVAPPQVERLVQVLREVAADVGAFRRKYYHPQQSIIAQFNRLVLTQNLASVLDELCPPPSRHATP